MFHVRLGGETVVCADMNAALAAMADLHARHGGVPVVDAAPAPAAPAFSSFSGPVVTDESAKARIEAQQASLIASGVKVNATEQLYTTGTRMAVEGYDTQADRKKDHDKLTMARDAAEALMATIRAENRKDVEVTSRDIARNLSVNGKILAYGRPLTEQAFRGLFTRSESPALTYVLGLRTRIVDAIKRGDLLAATSDKRKIAEVLQYELEHTPETAFKLRMREADIYAAVSPGYSVADAPLILPEVFDKLPRGAKGEMSYDATSTAWSLRAEVWTPTPVAEQAVGEAFRGFVTYQSRDNGTGSFEGLGGVELLRCLNASTYLADGNAVSRVHRGDMRFDIDAMTRGAMHAIDALCKAWGRNRDIELDVPSNVKINDVFPGFWRALLTSRSSELAGVLPGRTEAHVQALTLATESERRVKDKLVRADLAQGWTRYIQGQSAPVRREAESAIGDWLANVRPVPFMGAM